MLQGQRWLTTELHAEKGAGAPDVAVWIQSAQVEKVADIQWYSSDSTHPLGSAGRFDTSLAWGDLEEAI